MVLLDRNLFGAFFYLLFLGKQQFQDTIFIFSLYPIAVDTIIQVKAAFKALEGKLFTDGFVVFGLGFFLLVKTDGQLTVIHRKLEVFLASAGSAQFQMIGISRFMYVHRGKTIAFFPAQSGGKTLEKLIYKAGKALVAIVVYLDRKSVV